METAAHPRTLFKPRKLGTIFVTLTSSASLWTGVVKTFRCTSQMQSIADIIAAVDDEVAMEVHTFPTDSTEPTSAADSASLAAGQSAIADKWRPLAGSVLPFLSHHIGHDLAYSSMQLIDVPKCELLAQQLVAHADDDAVWLANHSSTIDDIVRGSYGWTPVSTWTFDLAYVAVGSKTTLFICFFAED